MRYTNAVNDGQHDHKSKATRARASKKGRTSSAGLAGAGEIPNERMDSGMGLLAAIERNITKIRKARYRNLKRRRRRGCKVTKEI